MALLVKTSGCHLGSANYGEFIAVLAKCKCRDFGVRCDLDFVLNGRPQKAARPTLKIGTFWVG